jgi:FkbM family methyltransferase
LRQSRPGIFAMPNSALTPGAAARAPLDDNHGLDVRGALRTRIIELGIRAIWGKSAFPVTMAADIPLISTGLRFGWLKTLGALGVQQFVARSGLGFKFVCHTGDLAEYPFYHRRAFQNELAICAAWLHAACVPEDAKPVVFDIGANVGFFCTQLAQMVAGQAGQTGRAVEIYAFEPVNVTFAKLVQSVERLGLSHCIHTVAAAVLDEPHPVWLHCPPRNSLYAQIAPHASGASGDDTLAHAAGITLDDFHKSAGVRPILLKIDVEGYEAAVLRGAQGMLSRPDRPAIVFEYYPDALAQYGAGPESFYQLLSGYALHYVDDFEGQRLPFGRTVDRLEDIQWGCNLFAVPVVEGSAARWAGVLQSAQQRARWPKQASPPAAA